LQHNTVQEGQFQPCTLTRWQRASDRQIPEGICQDAERQ